jgi:hypothetical protein
MEVVLRLREFGREVEDIPFMTEAAKLNSDLTKHPVCISINDLSVGSQDWRIARIAFSCDRNERSASFGVPDVAAFWPRKS